MIRGVVVILALIPLVLVLQGCGGGGGGACTNDKMMMVSQSTTMKGSVKVVADVLGQVSNQAIPMAVTMKIDMEWMRWYIGYETVTKMVNLMDPEQPEQDVTVVAKIMLDVKSKKAAIAFNMAGVGPAPVKTCNFMTVPFEGDVKEVAKCVKAGMETTNMAPDPPAGTTVDSSCSMEDGLDVWKVTIKNINVTATEEWKFDKDFKLQGMALTVNGKQENQTAQADYTLTAESPPTSTGPTEEDLDYTKWGMGNCTENPDPMAPSPPAPMPMAHFQANLPMHFKRLANMIPLLMKAHKGRRLGGETSWKCSVCQHVYDPAADGGGKAFEELPDTWVCPQCGQPKAKYEKAEGPSIMPVPGPDGLPAGMPEGPEWIKCFMPKAPGVVTV